MSSSEQAWTQKNSRPQTAPYRSENEETNMFFECLIYTNHSVRTFYT